VARSFLTAINLNKNELQNATVQNLGTAPSAPVKGQIYYDSTGNILYWWNGTTWVAAQGGAGVGYGSVPAETTFGISKNDGVATTVARSDHTHGSPAHSAAEHSTIPLSALAAATAAINMGGFTVQNVGTPVNGTDAANKTYVDNISAGLSWKEAVRIATTANVTQSGLPAIDGVTPAANDRVLCKDQTTGSQNGIWLAQSGAWTRALDFDAAGEAEGAAAFVMEGTVNADTAWVCTTNAPITIGTTALVWSQFAGGGTVTAGAGMTQSGNTLNVIGDASITVAADSISRAALTGDVTATAGANATTIANSVVTNAKLANMPALTFKGNQTGSAAAPQDLTPADMQANLGYLKKAVTGCAAATSTVFNHNMGSSTVAVTVYRAAAPMDDVECDIERTTINSVTVRFAVAPAAGDYWIMVMG
jgi:hypothetical protein